MKEDQKIKSEIIGYLNHHEGIAIGIKQDLFNEDVVKYARKTSFCQTYSEYKEYIKYRREISNPIAWINLENLTTEWNKSIS